MSLGSPLAKSGHRTGLIGGPKSVFERFGSQAPKLVGAMQPGATASRRGAAIPKSRLERQPAETPRRKHIVFSLSDLCNLTDAYYDNAIEWDYRLERFYLDFGQNCQRSGYFPQILA